MRTTGWLAVFLLALVLGACSNAPRVNVDYDTAFDFGAIQSFSVVDVAQDSAAGEAGTTLVEQRIRDSIQRNLRARGLEAVAPASADVIVAFHVVSQDKTRVTTYNTHYGYYGYRRGYPYGWGGTEVDVRNYTEGTLIIDVVKPDEKRIVWRGASSAVLRNRTPEERQQLIDTHVDAILAELPLQPR